MGNDDRKKITEAALRMQARQLSQQTFDLEKALGENRIEVYYQPIVRVLSGEIADFEAVSRWRREDGSLLAPESYVPALERQHVMYKLDTFVLHEVCRSYRSLVRAGRTPVPVAVQLSGSDFAATDVFMMVHSAATEFAVPPEYLNIEFAESVFDANDMKVLDGFARLHAAGYHIWIKDFGGSDSILSNIKEYRVNTLCFTPRFLLNYDRRSQVIISRACRRRISSSICGPSAVARSRAASSVWLSPMTRSIARARSSSDVSRRGSGANISVRSTSCSC